MHAEILKINKRKENWDGNKQSNLYEKKKKDSFI